MVKSYVKHFVLSCVLVFSCIATHKAIANDGAFIPAEIETTQNYTHPLGNIQPKRLSLQDIEKKLPKIAKSEHVYIDLNSDIKKSIVEKSYSERIVDELEQFGYDLFLNTETDQSNQQAIPAGTVQDNFILSAGDSLDIVIRGQINSHNTYKINNQGQLIIQDMPPITATGRTLKDITSQLEQEIQSLHNTQIYVSLSDVRQINILIVGHVNNPGRQNVTAFHSILDALSNAGGIKKTGSLRNIKLVRNGNSKIIDLYQLLLASNSDADKLLKDGDRIIVPPIGKTMAVSGNVKRPAIYELQNHKLSLHQALGMAGGVLTPGKSRYIKLEFTTNGEETVQDIETPNKKLFGDGSILMISQSEQKRTQEITLSGHTRQKGSHDIQKTKTLSGLINNEKVLGDDVYPLIGIIKRHDPDNLTKKLVAFSPRKVLKKEYDDKLQEGDSIQLFSMDEIRSLTQESNPLLHKVSVGKKEKIDSVTHAFLTERAVFIRGAVRQAGAYPVTKENTLENLIAVAGGTSLEANTENIEITSRKQGRLTVNLSKKNAKDIIIEPGDTIRVNQKFHKISDQSVVIIGEVNHPGRYDLSAGDTLSTLIERAGGLTKQSYSDGAIFSRATERKREENRYKAQAQDLQMKLAASMQQADKDKKPDMTQVSATKSLIAELNNATAIGRITVEANPLILQNNPDLDILLENGDKIYIPRRPLTVRVNGEVLSPASLQFQKGKDPLEYIYEAGGTTYYADKDRTFVIYPDGSAQPLRVSSWNHTAVMIPPGSTIIVPRDPKPFDFLESAERVSQMIANLAISGLYIEAIGDD